MLTQSSGSGIFRPRLRTFVAQPGMRCAGPHALVADHVALTLDKRVFGRVAQVMVPCDTRHALVVDHVALRRYSGCPQPFPSSVGSPNAHAMLLGRKSPRTGPPEWIAPYYQQSNQQSLRLPRSFSVII